MAEPSLDVLMTVYNGEQYIAAALSSLFGQSLTNFRVIVVDDGSTDTTPAILKHSAQQDHRLQVYTRSNMGVVKASNFGLRQCTAEYVSRADADDISFPHRLAEQIAFLNANPRVLAQSGAAFKIDMLGHRLATRSYSTDPVKADLLAVPIREPYLLHPFVTFRRSALEQLGGYRDLIVSEDSDIFWRLQELGQLHASQSIYGEYRMNPQSLSSKSIRSGRVMATCSQLAAFSARRRRVGEQDFIFSTEFADQIVEAAGTLEGVYRVASAEMGIGERELFAACLGMKLLEMADYRPYEVDFADCSFTGHWVEILLRSGRPSNSAMIRRSCSGTAARLAASGNRDAARALLSNGMRTGFYSRRLARRLIPSRAFQGLKSISEEISKSKDRTRRESP